MTLETLSSRFNFGYFGFKNQWSIEAWHCY